MNCMWQGIIEIQKNLKFFADMTMSECLDSSSEQSSFLLSLRILLILIKNREHVLTANEFIFL